VTGEVGSRPGGRSARVRVAVLDAADELVGAGVEPITVRLIAERSGVSEPTIYRRWRSADQVLLDAALRYLSESMPIQASGHLRRDLRRWAVNLEHGFSSPLGRRFLSIVTNVRSGGPHGQRAVHALAQDRLDGLRAMLVTDQAPVELSAEYLLDLVVAPLYTRQLFGLRTSRRLAEDLVDRALTAVE
jgi:AcrR family transcriptional regulator